MRRSCSGSGMCCRGVHYSVAQSLAYYLNAGILLLSRLACFPVTKRIREGCQTALKAKS